MSARPKGNKKRNESIPWTEESLDSIRKRLAESTPAVERPHTGSRLRAEKGTDPVEKMQDSPATDDELFRHAMADVRERPEFRRLSIRPGRRRKLPAASPGADLDALFGVGMVSTGEVRFQHTDEYMSGSGEGIRPDICLDLHAGRIPAQDHLDMHGMSLEAAKEALHRFIREARARRLRCVNVIHGRGLRSPEGPVLKEGLRNWLETGSLRKWVMAYATAPRKQGGPGATYLLLR